MEHLFRRCHGRLVASLVRAFGPARLDLAEEVVQDALLRALKVWPYRGVPTHPEAWLRRVARNRALDLVRREGRMEDLVEPAVLDRLALPEAGEGAGEDDELAMVLLCCHPSLSPDAQVALTLRTVGGLSTDEIAAAFLAERPTIQQRIARAKRTLAAEGRALQIPGRAMSVRRREAALAVLYLMFSEGYAASAGEALVRSELCAEAIRLARIMASHAALGGPEVEAFLALLLFQASRLTARETDDGVLVLLADQDRSRWDRALMAEGFRRLERATEADRVTRWHLEAGIASAHAAAASWAETDWPRILDLYDLLHHLAPSPVVAVNRAVAVAMARSPEEGLDALSRLEPQPGYYLLPATRGHLLSLAGRAVEATVETRRALMICRNATVRAHLARRIAALEERLTSAG